MLNDDIITAQRILSNSKSNLKSIPYHENSFIYKTTNEDITIYQHLFQNKKNLMSIIGSGDQVLNAIASGIYNIDCCDISVFPKYFLELKIGAIKALSKEEYIKFILDDFDEDLYDKTRPYLSKDSLEFWDSLFNFFESYIIYNSTLFSSQTYNVELQIDRNLYLRDYKKIKTEVEKANINYYDGDIYDVLNETNKMYDLVNLSSVIFYNQKLRETYKEYLSTQKCLSKNAQVFSYLYHAKSNINYINDCFNEENYSLKIKKDDGILIYQKK